MNNGIFMNLMDEVNTLAISNGYTNAISCAKEMRDKGLLSHSDFNSFHTYHEFRNNIAHGGALDIRITEQTLNGTKVFVKLISAYIQQTHKSAVPSYIQLDKEKRELERQKQFAEQQERLNDYVRSGDLVILMTDRDWYESTASNVPPDKANKELIAELTEEYKKNNQKKLYNTESLEAFLKRTHVPYEEKQRFGGTEIDYTVSTGKIGWVFRVERGPGYWNFKMFNSEASFNPQTVFDFAKELYILRPEKPAKSEDDTAAWLFHKLYTGSDVDLNDECFGSPKGEKNSVYVCGDVRIPTDRSKDTRSLSPIPKLKKAVGELEFRFVVKENIKKPSHSRIFRTRCKGYVACMDCFRTEDPKPLYKGDGNDLEEYLTIDKDYWANKLDHVCADDYVIVMTNERFYNETNSVLSPKEANNSQKGSALIKAAIEKTFKDKHSYLSGRQYAEELERYIRANLSFYKWNERNVSNENLGYVYRLEGRAGNWSFRALKNNKVCTLSEISQIATDIFVIRRGSMAFANAKDGENVLIIGKPSVSKFIHNAVKDNNSNACKKEITYNYLIKKGTTTELEINSRGITRTRAEEGYVACLDCFRAEDPKPLYRGDGSDLAEYLKDDMSHREKYPMAGDYVFVMTDFDFYYETKSTTSPKEANASSHRNPPLWNESNTTVGKLGYVFRLEGQAGNWKFRSLDGTPRNSTTYSLTEISEVATDIYINRNNYLDFEEMDSYTKVLLVGTPSVLNMENKTSGSDQTTNSEETKSKLFFRYFLKKGYIDSPESYGNSLKSSTAGESYGACPDCFKAEDPMPLLRLL